MEKLRQELKSTAREISGNPRSMREAKSAGIGGQVKSLIRKNQRELSRAKDFELER